MYNSEHIQYSTIQYNTVQYSTIQYNSEHVQYSTQYSTDDNLLYCTDTILFLEKKENTTVLYYTVLYCTTLHCTVLYCSDSTVQGSIKVMLASE